MSQLWALLDGRKTTIGGLLMTAAIGLGILTQDDVEALQATFPGILAGVAAVTQLVGLAHKAVKKLRG